MPKATRNATRPLPKPPDEATLRESALAHLARFAATQAGLTRVLNRRIDRWARAAEGAGLEAEAIAAALRKARVAVPAVVDALSAVGAVDDAAFADGRARRLTRQGKSRRATLAHLAGKGVDSALAESVVPEDPARDLAAACAYLRRRRLPPFGPGERVRTLAALARGGFARDIAERAVDLDLDEADAALSVLRQT
ncbi:MAG TPA: RecX family transcriptional regulator [Acidiphilium sp.]|nr:RecX family transcriptional regulator [Acidiphilium sp.]